MNVVLIDKNDNRPVFDPNHFMGSIPENSAAGLPMQYYYMYSRTSISHPPVSEILIIWPQMHSITIKLVILAFVLPNPIVTPQEGRIIEVLLYC